MPGNMVDYLQSALVLLDNQTKYVRSQMTPKNTWNHVIPPPPFEPLTKEKKFRLVHYDKKDFSVFHLMEKEVQEDELFRLREEITEVLLADSSATRLKEVPDISQVVLAPNPDHDDEYQRAVVEKLHLEAEDSWSLKPSLERSKVTVYFFDMGGTHQISVQKLKIMTEPIMQYPVLSYKVVLFTGERFKGPDGYRLKPFSSSGLILFKRFQTRMDIIKGIDLKVKLEKEEMPSPLCYESKLVVTYPVAISYGVKGKPSLLSNKLADLKLWEWEKFLNNWRHENALDDEHLCQLGVFGLVERELSSYKLEPGTEFNAALSRVVESSTSTSSEVGKYAELRVTQLTEPVHHNHFTVLHNQMDRYGKKIAASTFVPRIKDVFMFKLEKKLEYINLGIKHLGEWTRAMRLDAQWIYLIDYDQNIPLDGMEANDYEIRQLYGEFLQIPTLVIFIAPYENGAQMTFKTAKNLLQPGGFYKFRVSGETAEDDVYKAEYLGPVNIFGENGSFGKSSGQDGSGSGSDTESASGSSSSGNATA